MSADSWTQWVPWIRDTATSLARAQAVELKKRRAKSVYEIYEIAEEAVEFACVLDIFGLSKRKTAGKCLAVSSAACKKLIGSATPTHSDIVRAQDRILASLQRGESLCIVVYARGKPRELFFAGFTND